MSLQNRSETQEKIFKSLSNFTRLQILYELRDRHLTPSQLSKEHQISLPALKRHLDILFDANLVITKADGSLSLSTVSEIVLYQLPALRFATKFGNFIENYKVDVIPEKFLARIGELEDGRIIHGSFPTYEYAKNSFRNAKKFIKVCVVELPIQGYLDTIFQACNGVDVSLIVSDKAILGDEFFKIRKTHQHQIKNSTKFLKERTCPVDVTIQITEDDAMIGFPKKAKDDSSTNSNAPDGCMVGSDSRFMLWCNDLFDYFWQKCHVFNP